MLHFGVMTSVHPSVWGGRFIKSSETNVEYQLWELDARIPRPMSGQFRGGVGMFRTETGQPQTMLAGGAYAFDTYLTTYSFADGSYSIALEAWLTLAESFLVADAHAASMIAQGLLAESFSVSDTILSGVSAPITLAENLSVADTYAGSAVIALALPESILVTDNVSTGATLTTYVVNIRTGAVSNYSNFPFNSIAKVGTKYMATSPDGVYELTGVDDEGADISASITLPTTQLDTEEVPEDVMKRLPTAYLGVATTGDMVLRVTANGASNYYTLAGTTTASVHTGRMMLGRGVAARYWDFELTNVRGADFTLESITFHPVALARRVGRN